MRSPREPISAACTSTREHLSARADRATTPDAAADAHLAGCPACRAWAAALTSLPTPSIPRTPDITAAAVAAFRRDAHATAGRGRVGAAPREAAPLHGRRGRPTQIGVARGLLVAAGMAGVLVALAALIGTGWAVPLADHLGRDLAGLQGALAVGFLLAAWRPARYGRGLLPVAAIAALVTILPGAADASRAAASLVVEAAHLPLLAGATGLLLLADATGGLLPRRA